MNQPQTPKACYSVKTAAEKLNIRPDNLLKKMVIRGWLHPGSYRKDPLRFMPLEKAIADGFVKKIKRHAPAPHDWEIAVTQKGLNDLGEKMQNVHPIPKPLNEQTAQQVKAQTNTTAANEEREKCLDQLKEWGLAS